MSNPDHADLAGNESLVELVFVDLTPHVPVRRRGVLLNCIDFLRARGRVSEWVGRNVTVAIDNRGQARRAQPSRREPRRVPIVEERPTDNPPNDSATPPRSRRDRGDRE